MLRLTHRGETAAIIRAGYHSGDGRRTLCGKKDGPWALTERAPTAKQCFVCDHRTRWNARDLDPNILVPRPLTPLKVLVDAGPIDQRLVDFFGRHPQSLDAWHASVPLTERAMWSTSEWQKAQQGAERIGQSAGPPGVRHAPSERWSAYTISDKPDVGVPTDLALQRLPDWADAIERALVAVRAWSKESPGRKRG